MYENKPIMQEGTMATICVLTQPTGGSLTQEVVRADVITSVSGNSAVEGGGREPGCTTATSRAIPTWARRGCSW